MQDVNQLARRLSDAERLISQLMMPKSKSRTIINDIGVGLAKTTSTITAKSGFTLGSGTADDGVISYGPPSVDYEDSIPLFNQGGTTIATDTEIPYITVQGVRIALPAFATQASALLLATLTSNSHDWSAGDSARGFTADQVTPITYSGVTIPTSAPVNGNALATIENPHNLNWVSGDSAILYRKPGATTIYYVLRVFKQVCTRFRFKLTANAPNGLTPALTATAICPTNADGGPPPTGSITIQDIYGLAHNAKTDHKGVAEYDYNNGWWYVTECEHNAWRFRGTLNGTLSGGASFFSVNPVVAFNGKLPSGPLNVWNMHSWADGTNGYVVSCEWNPVDGRYEAYQMRCPA